MRSRIYGERKGFAMLGRSLLATMLATTPAAAAFLPGLIGAPSNPGNLGVDDAQRTVQRYAVWWASGLHTGQLARKA